MRRGNWAVVVLVAALAAPALAVSGGTHAHAASAARPPAATPSLVQGRMGARIDTFMTRVAELGLQGTLLVEQDGRVIVHKGYGVIDRERRRRATPDTPYHLGSLGKQFTAAAILKLESQGKLSTGDRLSRWFANVPADKRDITIDHLLHQSSGLPYLPRGSFDDPLSLDSLVVEILGYPLSFEPGTRYQYSSPGYNLLAAIVQKASGMRYNDYLRRELWRPAGMTRTSGEDDTTRWVGALVTPSYSGLGPDPPIYPVPTRSKAIGAGSVVSTTGDLFLWEQALRAGTVLDTTATRKLFAPAIRVSPTVEYACAWNVARSARGTTVIMHAGDLGGFNTDMRRLVDEHATIIFLCNSRDAGRGYRDPVSVAVTRLLFGPPPEMPPARVRLSPAARSAWNARWSIGGGDSLAARVHGDQVEVSAWTQGGLAALAGGDSAARVLEAVLSARADTVAASLVAGQVTPIAQHFHPSLPEDVPAQVAAGWQELADSLGAPVQVTIIGTAANGPASGKTLVRLTGPRGSQVMSLDWARGQLVNTEPVPGGAYELSFVPVGPRRLAHFDLWAGRTTFVERPK